MNQSNEYNKGFVDGVLHSSHHHEECPTELEIVRTTEYVPAETFPDKIVIGMGDRREGYIKIEAIKTFISGWIS